MNIQFRLILSIVIITVLGFSGIAATRAFLTDQVTLTANAFSTGTVDLQIKVGSDAYADTHVGFTDTVSPGQTKSKFFVLKNNGTGITLATAAQAASVSGMSSDSITIAITPWTSTTSSGHVEAGAVTTTHTLTEWASAPSALGIPDMGPGNIQDYRMDVTVNPDVTTSGISTFDFVFTGQQVNPTPTP